MRVEIAAFGLAEEEERIILAFLRAPPVAFYLCVNKEYMESHREAVSQQQMDIGDVSYCYGGDTRRTGVGWESVQRSAKDVLLGCVNRIWSGNLGKIL